MKKDYSGAISHTAKILDAWLPYKIQYDRIPGLSVGVVHDGKLIYKAGFGYADIEAKKRATPETCYRIASISKIFTSVAILQLVEQGKLSLDDPLEKHLPWFRVKNKIGDSRHITIRQALSHTAGVFRDGITPHWETDKFPDERQLRKSVSNKTIVFENQTRFKYSNFGFALLGEVIKKVSGMSYQEYVTRHIIQRLNLESTAPDLNPKIVARLAKGYARPIPNEKRQSFSHTKTNAYASATGFASNVIDLAKFLSALTVARQGEKGENTILDRESKKEMMREYWKATEEGDFYGLGLGIYRIEKRKVVGHGGGFAGFITRVSLDIENDIGVITLSNTNDSSAGAINTGIFETIYDLVDDKDIYAGDKKLPDEKKYEGAYRSRGSDKVIVGINGKLVAFDPKVNSPLKNKTLLKPSGKDRFIMETKFNFDSPGEIAKFVFEKEEARAKKLIWGSTPLERLERSMGVYTEKI